MAENNYESDNTLDNEQRKFQPDFLGNSAANILDTAGKIGDPTLLISTGLIAGLEQRNKGAFNPDVDQALTEDIMVQGGTHIYASAAQTLDVSSTSVNDAVAGTGAQTVFIRGVDGSYNEITATGTIPFTTTESFLRVNDFQVLTAGSTGFNEGTITALQSGSGIELSRIGLDAKDGGLNNSFQFLLTVPLGKVMAITSLVTGVSRMTGAGGIKEGGIFFAVRPFGGVFIPGSFSSSRSDGASSTVIAPTYPAIIPEKADIRARGIAFANNSGITLNMQYTLIDKTIFGVT